MVLALALHGQELLLRYLKVDMARLALVRKRREEAEARKAEEAAGEGKSNKEKMEKEAKAKAGSGGPQKLNPLEVKSMYLYMFMLRVPLEALMSSYIMCFEDFCHPQLCISYNQA